MSRNDMVEISGTVLHTTDMAILIDAGTGEAWLPRSQIEFDAEPEKGDFIIVQVPEWLAQDKGLI